jgi:enoyl-CoA hydratase/carnithine racemase
LAERHPSRAYRGAIIEATEKGKTDMTESSPTAPRVELSIDGPVATVALNRPEVRNAIDDETRTELIAILDRLANDDAVRAVVITGKGGAFCAGGDISGMQQRLKAPPGDIAFNGWRRQRRTHQGIAALHGLAKPTIAAVNGAAVGLGCDMALCCDFIIAAETASFAMSFINRGLIPDGGGLYFLPRRVGLPRAKELIFTGRRVKADEALAIGLADRLTDSANLLKEAQAWAVELSRGSSAALALSKSILDKTFELTDEQVFALGREAQAICYTTGAHQEAVAAFLNKTSR